LSPGGGSSSRVRASNTQPANGPPRGFATIPATTPFATRFAETPRNVRPNPPAAPNTPIRTGPSRLSVWRVAHEIRPAQAPSKVPMVEMMICLKVHEVRVWCSMSPSQVFELLLVIGPWILNTLTNSLPVSYPAVGVACHRYLPHRLESSGQASKRGLMAQEIKMPYGATPDSTDVVIRLVLAIEILSRVLPSGCKRWSF
jgi:hypothetical protein